MRGNARRSCKFAILSLIALTILAPVHGLGARDYIVAFTEDGHEVALYTDRTWEYLSHREEQDWTSYIHLEKVNVQYIDGIIPETRFELVFKNVGDKTIIGIQFSPKFLDPFGDPIGAIFTLFEVLDVVPPGEHGTGVVGLFRSTSDLPQKEKDFVWLIEAGIVKMAVSVEKVAFADGTVISFAKTRLVFPDLEGLRSPSG